MIRKVHGLCLELALLVERGAITQDEADAYVARQYGPTAQAAASHFLLAIPRGARAQKVPA